MADTFTEKVIEDGPRNFVKSFAYTYVDTGQTLFQTLPKYLFHQLRLDHPLLHASALTIDL